MEYFQFSVNRDFTAIGWNNPLLKQIIVYSKHYSERKNQNTLSYLAMHQLEITDPGEI